MSKYSLQPPSSDYNSVPSYAFQQPVNHQFPPPYSEHQQQPQHNAVIYNKGGFVVPEQQPYIPSQYEVNGVLNPASNTIIQYTTGNNLNQGKAQDWDKNPNSCCTIL
ncbi:hypothetical protein C9374_002755 [Naegleria lovaniensis]|uniref:Uncharacterized protein n=1 Tax=Naegleria lovaniensis TaxID=51637 RepID=A0AA88GUC1_NAELO|nr:uncharacterized protein C9374_002755 [Naegleria lovaniensis]KAG2386309.1 hypothetical protein C9374_002755 [Naegleria lovaniensis]